MISFCKVRERPPIGFHAQINGMFVVWLSLDNEEDHSLTEFECCRYDVNICH